MNSMTGFGHAEGSGPDLDVTVEIRTLNGRYLDLSLRLPKELAVLEPILRKDLQASLRRGRVELHVGFVSRSSGQFELNRPLLENYLSLTNQLREAGVEDRLQVSEVLKLPGILIPRVQDFTSADVLSLIRSTLASALEQVVETRKVEGKALAKDLSLRIELLEGYLKQIERHADSVTEQQRRKLQQKVREVLQDQVVDSTRLSQEIVFHAERSDVGEEISRMWGHMERLRELLVDDADESVGRGMDFLCQEMNREMNTILSKAVLPEISAAAVAGKAEVEKIREQVQNVE